MYIYIYATPTPENYGQQSYGTENNLSLTFMSSAIMCYRKQTHVDVPGMNQAILWGPDVVQGLSPNFVRIYGGFLSHRGTPLHHPCDGIFHEINPPFWGSPSGLWTPHASRFQTTWTPRLCKPLIPRLRRFFDVTNSLSYHPRKVRHIRWFPARHGGTPTAG